MDSTYPEQSALSSTSAMSCRTSGNGFAHGRNSHCVNAELLLSTPLTVVVKAQLSYIDADGRADVQELALVIPRSRCAGDHPYWPALLSAATEHWQRCRGSARHLSACVDGEWQTVLTAQTPQTTH